MIQVPELEKLRFWMRPVSFTGLQRILHLLAAYPSGLTAKSLDELIVDQRVYLTQKDSAPAKTTLYHCRNTLLKLGAIRQEGKLFVVHKYYPPVDVLLHEKPSDIDQLSARSQDAFATLVLKNEDCWNNFFNLFVRRPMCNVNEFRGTAEPVSWISAQASDSRRRVILRATDGREITLTKPIQIQSVLYGLRYWSRNELCLTDEIFREDKGVIMYPTWIEEANHTDIFIDSLLQLVGKESNQWTTLSFRDIAIRCIERNRLRLAVISHAMERLSRDYPGLIVLVPTSRSQATLTASSAQREDLELRGYFQDARGRIFSHIRIHNSLNKHTYGNPNR
jgi:hypothetical protein